jgi:hypothetical protein
MGKSMIPPKALPWFYRQDPLLQLVIITACAAVAGGSIGALVALLGIRP